MTRKMSQFFTALLLLTLASCAGTVESEHGMDTTSPTGKAGISISPADLTSTIDPICNMNLANAKISDTAHYNGGIYAFCSPGCKADFQKDPAKYVKQ
ncbi:hypothetical protein BH09BAC1_BH09BAC1_05980 [soil metagenome]